MSNTRHSREDYLLVTSSLALNDNYHVLEFDSSTGVLIIPVPDPSLSTNKYTFMFKDVTNSISFPVLGGGTIDTITPIVGVVYTIQSDGSTHWSATAQGSGPVLMSSTVALVNGQGNDSNGEVGNRSKPFATIQAAANAIPVLGTVLIEDMDIVETVTVTNTKFYLKNSQWNGDIAGSFIFLGGNKSSSINPSVSGLSSAFSRSMYEGNITAAQTYVEGLNKFVGTIKGPAQFSAAIMNVGTVANAAITLFGDGTTVPARCALINVDTVDVGKLVDALPGPTNGDFLEIRSCPKIRCTGMYSGYSDNTNVEIVNSNIDCVGDALVGSVAGGTANTRLTLIHSTLNVTSGGRIINMAGVGAVPGITIVCREQNTIRVDGAENIAWTGNPALAVIVTSKSNLTKTRDGGSGVVNEVITPSLDTINANL